MTHNTIPMTRILSEDVGAFDLFAPGASFERAKKKAEKKEQARKARIEKRECARLSLKPICAETAK